MYVGMARLSVVIAQGHSLNEQRMGIRRVKDRVRERAGIAAADDDSTWIPAAWREEDAS